MTLRAELYFSYRSPYSYLGMKRYRELTRRYDLEIEVRPVFPIAIRDPGFFDREDPQWLGYLLKDVVRLAEFTGQPFARPNPDPVNMDNATREISNEQPHIRPVTYMGVEAARRGRGMAFTSEVSSMIWGGTKAWNADGNMTVACARAGLDFADMAKAIEGREAEYEAAVEANQAALEDAGHWGVPTLVFDGEPFFGQDRTEMALWRMRGAGLKER